MHLLELDLLRRGTRPLVHPRLPASDYLVGLTRAGASSLEAWPLGLRDPLPVVPVPLRAPDPDAWVDLGAALRAVYDEAGYDLSIDGAAVPPPPALADDLDAWRRTLGR